MPLTDQEQNIHGEKHFQQDVTAAVIKAPGSDGMQLQDDGGNVAVQVSDGGRAGFPGASRVRVTKNDVQGLPDATITVVEYDDEDFDNLGEFNATTYRFTPTLAAGETGCYLVTASLQTANSTWTDGDLGWMAVYKNGTAVGYVGFFDCYETAQQYMVLHGTTLVEMVAGDYLDIRAKITRGATTNTGTNPLANHLSIHRLS